MNTPNKSLLDRLDSLARWTDVAALTGPYGEGPRPLKWQPIAILCIATVVFLYFLTNPTSIGRSLLLNVFGPILFITSVLMPSFGPFRPYKNKKTSEGMDEREGLVWRDAQLFSFTLVGGLQLMGFPALIVFAFTGSWSSVKILVVLGAFLFYLGIVFTCLLTLYGSWHIGSPEPDED
jgi:hypothetical protein